MPVFRSLRYLALMLVMPACAAVAQEEAAESTPPTPTAASEASAEPENQTPDDAQSEESKSEDPKPEDPKSDTEKPDVEESKPDAPPAEPEPPQAPEPRRLTGLGSVDGPDLPGQPWRVHDLFRPRPPVVSPAEVDLTVPPPSDAVVLFSGSDLAAWGHRDREHPGSFFEPQWKVEDGYFEVTSGSGDLFTLDSFGSVQLHLEWATPVDVRGRSQGRGNSGVKFLGLYEVQILDSYDNRTYADGHAASIYGQYPPAVNACRPPGQWQSYDIIFEIPQFDGERLVRPGYLTVLHNGVLVHHRRELAGVTGMRSPGEYDPHPPAGPIMLQDHGSPIRFRNIWVRTLD